jgi:outer membrane protein TolC
LGTLDLSTHAELASDYFTLRGQDAQQALVDQTVVDYAKALSLTQVLFKGGAVARADVDQANAQFESARTQAADIRLQRAQTEHAIAVLVGESASTFHLDPRPMPADLGPPAIEPGLPSVLLERRPDVAAAERRVAAANAQIGVARAAYFPVFDLFGKAGFESTETSNWISAPSRLWSVGPSAMLTLFDAGRHRAQSAQAHAQARCSPHTRRWKTVLLRCATWNPKARRSHPRSKPPAARCGRHNFNMKAGSSPICRS